MFSWKYFFFNYKLDNIIGSTEKEIIEFDTDIDLFTLCHRHWEWFDFRHPWPVFAVSSLLSDSLLWSRYINLLLMVLRCTVEILFLYSNWQVWDEVFIAFHRHGKVLCFLNFLTLAHGNSRSHPPRIFPPYLSALRVLFCCACFLNVVENYYNFNFLDARRSSFCSETN